uniref:C1q and TNF related 3 n=1 Tax=Equus caballus TaxID=9796 RepID=A0A9L0SIY8_HORSE
SKFFFFSWNSLEWLSQVGAGEREFSSTVFKNSGFNIWIPSYETKGKSDTSSNHAVLKLAKGDEVWLRMGNGALHGDHQRFSTFAGFLLFETK